jgi:hypothetical protein
LTRWGALTRYVGDGMLRADNNHVENQIRPWRWAGPTGCSLAHCAPGQRAAAVMSLIQSAKLNGHHPYAYLKDVFTRLPTHAGQSHRRTAPASLTAERCLGFIARFVKTGFAGRFLRSC